MKGGVLVSHYTKLPLVFLTVYSLYLHFRPRKELTSKWSGCREGRGGSMTTDEERWMSCGKFTEMLFIESYTISLKQGPAANDASSCNE